MSSRPQNRADLVAMLSTHPGWNALKEEFAKRLKDETDRVVNGTLYDQETISKHHISIGRIRAWQEVLDFPDNVQKARPPRQ